MEFVDILITLVIFAVFTGSEVLKKKKKAASTASQKVHNEVDFGEDYESPERDYFKEREKWKNEKFDTNSSKSTSYFTYEDVSSSEEVIPPSMKAEPSSSAKINVQEVENEIETPKIDLHDPEEIKKAIIYGEILKNPYN